MEHSDIAGQHELDQGQIQPGGGRSFITKAPIKPQVEARALIESNFCEKATGPNIKDKVTKEFQEKGRVIKPERAIALFTDAKLRGSVTVVDLRSGDEAGDKARWNLRIPGAKSHPIPEKAENMDDPRRLRAGMHPTLTDTDIKRNWAAQLGDQHSIWASVLEKPVVIFHCRQSANRTPGIANNYLNYVAGTRNPAPQLVLILDGGFDAYLTAVDDYLKVDKNKNNRPLILEERP
ncbi:hypothetical protein B0H63DRAFT_509534 [Podospora didyma]|uniref:Rhodanese domain-containing protein n=1 Tax=Podospora didyma TaxID=330526 RepID=A0AAE0U248_9PEZI|nr:hypothetical protein B0H63DRAFT_509534 [Podospora didyma]